jgi:hypothetical protein
MVRICVLACAHFLKGGGDTIGRIAGRRRLDYPGSFADAQMDGMTASGAKRTFVEWRLGASVYLKVSLPY